MLYLLGRALLLLALVCPLLAHSQPDPPPTPAQLLSTLEQSIFQIRIIDVSSGSLSALGTGFVVAEGLVATNYHVVSSYALRPQDYRIEIVHGDTKLSMAVVSVDVVSDLALLEVIDGALARSAFKLAGSAPDRGDALYSLGNPHNLGLTLVQGTYNGLVEHQFLDRVHFTGAINPGMSGGPTVNQAAEVVGINVATAGNQIGFLVPVAKLVALLARERESIPLAEVMARQVGETTTAMIDAVLAAQWPALEIGSASILGQTVDWLECWGNTSADEDRGLTEIARGCNNDDNIFISPEFSTGFVEYEFYYVQADKWPAPAFYRLVAENTGSARPGNSAGEDDVGNYQCVDRVIDGDAAQIATRRVSYCLRPYQTLPGLFDAFYIGVTQDRADRAVMDHFTLAGVRRDVALRFLERFLGVLKWQ